MGRTKKVKSAGRYGVRYGLKQRKKIINIEKEQRKKHICPSCKKPSLKRMASGIWYCEKCGTKLAGKAYTPG